MASELVLVTGGRRSGKSAFAARLAAELAGQKHVLYVATALLEPGDEPMRDRVARHREARPRDWVTVESGADLGAAVTTAGDHGAVLVDSVTLWVSGLLAGYGSIEKGDTALVIAADAVRLAEVWTAAARSIGKPTVVVTDEVGSGVVPATVLGNVFADVLGEVNQMVARRAERVYLLVSGVPVRVK